MLKAMRDGTQSILLKGFLTALLFLALAGLVFTDVSGVISGGGVGRGTVAKVGPYEITTVEFDNSVQRALRARELDRSTAFALGLPRTVLSEEIDARLYRLAAHDFGLRVGDATVALHLKSILQPLVQSGMTERQALERILQSNNIREAVLVESLRADLATEALLRAIATGATPPAQLVQDALKHKHEERKGEYFRIKASEIPTPSSPDEETLRSFYQAVAQDYALPEFRKLKVAVLNAKTLAEEISVSEQELREAYNERLPELGEPEKRNLSQVITQDQETARAIISAVKNAKDLQTAAQSVAADAHIFIEAETFDPRSIPVELAQVAFSAKKGEAAGPVKSPLGWHVIKVEEVIPGKAVTFEQARAEIERDVRLGKTYEILYDRANQIDDMLAGGESLDAVAQEMGFAVVTLPPVSADGKLTLGAELKSDISALDRVLAAGFSLDAGNASHVIETSEGDFIAVEVDEIVPSRQRSFDDVRTSLERRWIKEQRERALDQIAQATVERIAAGEDFGTVAQDLKKSVITTGYLKRGDAGSAMPSPGFSATLFGLEAKGAATVLESDGDAIVLRLIDSRVPNDIDFASEDERKAFVGLLTSAMQQDIVGQFTQALSKRHGVKINERVLNEMYASSDDEDLY